MKATRRSRRAPSTPVRTAPIGAAPAPILEQPADTEQPFAEGAADALGPDLRHRLVSETAYHHLEERGYAEGSEVEDWSEAEAEVDHTLIHPGAPGKDID